MVVDSERKEDEAPVWRDMFPPCGGIRLGMIGRPMEDPNIQNRK
jgi:hypothetical protein